MEIYSFIKKTVIEHLNILETVGEKKGKTLSSGQITCQPLLLGWMA